LKGIVCVLLLFGVVQVVEPVAVVNSVWAAADDDNNDDDNDWPGRR
jgi:hypothetical protein